MTLYKKAPHGELFYEDLIFSIPINRVRTQIWIV